MRSAMVNDRFLLNQRSLGWLLLIALIVLGAGLGLRDPWPADEPRFALIAKEMVESGQWLFPMRGGEIYPDKPPLFMWGIAIGYLLTGSIKVAFLLPSLLAGLLTIVLVWDLGRRLWNPATGFMAGLLLLFTVQFTLQAKTAQIDALVTFFITLGVYGFMRFLLCGGGWRWYWLGWFAAGLGIITKGVGLLALLILIPAVWTHRDRIRVASPADCLKALAGPLFMLLAIGLWLVPMLSAVAQSGGTVLQAYRDNILLRQTVTRYANAWHHVKPFWYYLSSVIPPFWLPLSLLLPWLVLAWRKGIQGQDKRVILLLGYLVLVVLFFSLSPGKRGVYVTPGTPALALLTAPYMGTLLARVWPGRLLGGLGWLLGIVCVGGAGALAVSDKLANRLGDLGPAPWLPLLVLGAALLLVNVLLRRAPLSAILCSLAVGWLLYSCWICVRLNDMRTPQGVMALAAQKVPAGEELLLAGFKEQHLLFARQPVQHYPYLLGDGEQAREAAAWVAAAPKRHVLGSADLMVLCFEPEKMENLGNRHRTDWLLAGAEALKPACQGLTPRLEPFRYTPGP
ncbi:glycosyltransferase family 39 protein [Aeromonas rivipollensis]|uniref:Glycosyltransferase family 39 protein n=2 Tax=Aeromonas rivipollensis TaxID=948519 RepID=A0ABX0CZB0_9GAMM|nr:glycosyltransferase family 39 protein [Aeromonas rivipollensis]NEY05742.1 glycosyltransferase family 39 protein [Aeromonas rivipollensis]